jgi:hypothetical protein
MDVSGVFAAQLRRIGDCSGFGARIGPGQGLLVDAGGRPPDTTSNFAEIVFAILGVAAKLERRRIWNAPRAAGPTPRRTASNSAAIRRPPRTTRKRPAPARSREDAAHRGPSLQRQSEHDFSVDTLERRFPKSAPFLLS